MRRLLAILNALVWIAVLVVTGYCLVMVWLKLPWYAALLITFGLLFAHDHDGSVLGSWVMLPMGFIAFFLGALKTLWNKIKMVGRVN